MALIATADDVGVIIHLGWRLKGGRMNLSELEAS